MAQPPGFAALTDALIRRASTSFHDGCPDGGAAWQAAAAPGWREDVRLFAITWAAGFVFFLTFLA